jgi:hypothetical protein
MLNKELLIGFYDSAFDIELTKFWSFGITNTNATLSGFEVEYTSSSMLVDWGDQQRQFISSGAQTSHTFASNSSGIGLLAGGSVSNNSTITLINCGQTNPKLKGVVYLSAYTGLNEFVCRNNNITGIVGIPNLTAVSKINLELNDLTGSIPTLSSNTSLTEFVISFNELTGFDGGSVSSTIDIFEADFNQLTTTAVDNILIAFAQAGNTTTPTRLLNLGGGSNGAPSGAGLTSRSTLTAAGWTVITN